MQNPQLKTVAFHITPVCSHRCGMCYYAGENEDKKPEHPPLQQLKDIIDVLKGSSVENIIYVGGDPGDYPDVVSLAKYSQEQGFSNTVLSNTLRFPKFKLLEASQYFDAFEATIHSNIAQEHDQFCGMSGAYNFVTDRMKQLSDNGKTVGVVINLTPQTAEHAFEIAQELVEDKGIKLSYVGFQRIAPTGRAEGKDDYTLSQEQLIKSFENIEKIEQELGLSVEMMDTFPHCSVPQKYHKYLNTCTWGIDMAALDHEGNLSRCGADPSYNLGNIFKQSVEDIWQNTKSLNDFRNLEHLDETCTACKDVTTCQGGCLTSSLDSTYGVDILRSKGR